METPQEIKPAKVPARDKPAGEASVHVAGAEPGVWTERMLTALARGLRGNQWFSLIDKVYADRTLDEPIFEHRFAEHSYGFKHSHPATFPRLDSYIRGGLRSILRKRAGKRGRGRGTDHQRWRNHYFDGLGLFSLKQAHISVRQPPR